MKKIFIVAMLSALPLITFGQRPKLNIKAFAGYNTHIFVYKEYEKSKDVIHGWQGGFGFRVTEKKLMLELDFLFIRNGIIVALPDSLVVEEFDKFEFKLNSFEIPLKIGFVPVKTPLFKWYCFTGASFRFNTKGKLNILGEEVKFKPKEVGLANPNVDFILGSQVDIGWFNLELIYGLGVTNSLRENIRTNSHEIILNAGIIF